MDIISKKIRSALRLLSTLAKSYPDHISVLEISEQAEISVSYCEQIISRLSAGGITHGVRGPGGGYCLRRPAKVTTLLDVLKCFADVDVPDPLFSLPEFRRFGDVTLNRLN